MSAVLKIMADETRPQVEHMARGLYLNRSGGMEPPPKRLKYLVDKAITQMCKAIERAEDEKLPAEKATKLAAAALEDYLTTELDGEFRFTVLQ